MKKHTESFARMFPNWFSQLIPKFYHSVICFGTVSFSSFTGVQGVQVVYDSQPQNTRIGLAGIVKPVNGIIGINDPFPGIEDI